MIHIMLYRPHAVIDITKLGKLEVTRGFIMEFVWCNLGWRTPVLNQPISAEQVRGFKWAQEDFGPVSWLQDGGVPVHVSPVQCLRRSAGPGQLSLGQEAGLLHHPSGPQLPGAVQGHHIPSQPRITSANQAGAHQRLRRAGERQSA